MLTKLIIILRSLIIVRLLSEANYGVFSFIITSLTIWAFVVNPGLDVIVQNTEDESDSKFTNTILASIFLTLIAIILLGLRIIPIASDFLFVFIVLIFTFGQRSIIIGNFLRFDKFNSVSLIYILEALFSFLIVIPLAWFYNLYGALYGYMISSIFLFLLLHIWNQRLKNGFALRSVSLIEIYRIVKKGMKISIGKNIIMVLDVSVVYFFYIIYRDYVLFAYFQICFNLYFLSMTLLNVPSISIATSQSTKIKDNQKLKLDLVKIWIIGVTLAIIGGLLLYIISYQMIYFYAGASYAQYHYILQAFALYPPFMFTIKYFSSFLYIKKTQLSIISGILYLFLIYLGEFIFPTVTQNIMLDLIYRTYPGIIISSIISALLFFKEF